MFQGRPGDDMDQRQHAPVEIAGAGPAGLAAAITLARAGRQVIVHEAYKEVGHRFGRDFQGLENWTTREDVLMVFKELGLTNDFIAMPCRGGIAFDSTGKAYDIKSDETLFYIIERGPGPGTLDSALLNQAQSLGVEVRFNSRLRQVVNDGIFAAGPRVADAISVGYHFNTDMTDGYWVICDDELAPQGYAYLLVMDGRGTVKSCMFSGFKQQRIYVQRTVEAFQRLTGLKMRDAKPHGGSSNFHIPRTAYRGTHPLVGEQAGFQDTLWGFGMRLAITSGVLAARSLINIEDYDSLWQRELKPQMKTSVVNRALFSLLGNRGYGWYLSWMTSQPNLRRALRQQYQGAWYKNLLYAWARQRYQSQYVNINYNHNNYDCI